MCRTTTATTTKRTRWNNNNNNNIIYLYTDICIYSRVGRTRAGGNARGRRRAEISTHTCETRTHPMCAARNAVMVGYGRRVGEYSGYHGGYAPGGLCPRAAGWKRRGGSTRRGREGDSERTPVCPVTRSVRLSVTEVGSLAHTQRYYIYICIRILLYYIILYLQSICVYLHSIIQGVFFFYHHYYYYYYCYKPFVRIRNTYVWKIGTRIEKSPCVCHYTRYV